MDPSDADSLTNFVTEYQRRIRMEYGQVMEELGIDQDTAIKVQQKVAFNMIVWLDQAES